MLWFFFPVTLFWINEQLYAFGSFVFYWNRKLKSDNVVRIHCSQERARLSTNRVLASYQFQNFWSRSASDSVWLGLKNLILSVGRKKLHKIMHWSSKISNNVLEDLTCLKVFSIGLQQDIGKKKSKHCLIKIVYTGIYENNLPNFDGWLHRKAVALPPDAPKGI